MHRGGQYRWGTVAGAMPLPQAGLQELTADSPDQGVRCPGPGVQVSLGSRRGPPAARPWGSLHPVLREQTVGAACSLNSTVCT